MPRAVATFVTVVLLAGCGAGSSTRSSTPRRPHEARVAVLPMHALADVTLEADPVASLAETLGHHPGIACVPAGEVATALEGAGEACAEELECVRHVGTLVGATHVVVPTFVALGDTVLVRFRLVEVAGAHGDRVSQEVVQGTDAASMTALGRRVGRELGDGLAPQARRRRMHPALIATLAVVGAGAVATTVALTVERKPQPDVVVTPP